jgi:Ca-activated chloride channel homolog
MRLSLRTDRQLIRASARSTRYVMISLVAPVAPPRAGRLPVNVGIVLDRSGSMAGERKFPLARDAVEQALRLLRPEDRFTLVIYDQEVNTLVSATLATPEARRLAMQRLAEVEPRGSTDLHSGWTTAASELADHLSKDSVNRVLLLTDGLANHGITDHQALVAHAGELRRRGIATTTFGVGADFDERLLRDMAHEGGGQFYFIETPAQIPDLLTSELGEALEVVRRDVALQLTLPTGAEAEPLNRYRSAYDASGAFRVELGDLTSGQEVTVVLRVRFPRGENGATTNVGVAVTAADAPSADAASSLRWQYASHADNDGQSRDRVVDREVARLYVARARADATEANRAGDFEGARRVLEETARRIHGYTFGDPELQRLRHLLLAEMRDYTSGPMSAMALKSAFFVAESGRKNREPDGKVRRARQE